MWPKDTQLVVKLNDACDNFFSAFYFYSSGEKCKYCMEIKVAANKLQKKVLIKCLFFAKPVSDTFVSYVTAC